VSADSTGVETPACQPYPFKARTGNRRSPSAWLRAGFRLRRRGDLQVSSNRAGSAMPRARRPGTAHRQAAYPECESRARRGSREQRPVSQFASHLPYAI
jgi:hypothetical protein